MRQEKSYAWRNDCPYPNHMRMKLRVTLRFIFSISIAAGLLFGCMTAQKIDPSVANKYEGFISDSKTAKQEVQDRLGSATSVYEDGRILIYYVHLQDDGRMNLTGSGTCHALVLVFDKDDLLERHSLVKHGCRE